MGRTVAAWGRGGADGLGAGMGGGSADAAAVRGLDDAFGARKRLKGAIEYNAAIILRFWGEMSRNDATLFPNPANADSFPFQMNAEPLSGDCGESV